MDLLAIGSRIRSQREYLGYTREQLAEYLGAKGMPVPHALQNFQDCSAEDRLYLIWQM